MSVPSRDLDLWASCATFNRGSYNRSTHQPCKWCAYRSSSIVILRQNESTTQVSRLHVRASIARARMVVPCSECFVSLLILVDRVHKSKCGITLTVPNPGISGTAPSLGSCKAAQAAVRCRRSARHLDENGIHCTNPLMSVAGQESLFAVPLHPLYTVYYGSSDSGPGFLFSSGPSSVLPTG